MRIGIFGGSFDPIHHGHVIVARHLREALQLDEVRLIPAGEQPFKVGRHGAAATDRATMVELAVEGEAGLAVDRTEVERVGPSYMIDTVRGLMAPGGEYVLLLGADAAREFGKWREAEALRRLVRVVAFGRGGDHGAEGLGFEVAQVPLIELSGTAIRARLKAGRSIRFMVPDRVCEYIATHGLYRGGKA